MHGLCACVCRKDFDGFGDGAVHAPMSRRRGSKGTKGAPLGRFPFGPQTDLPPFAAFAAAIFGGFGE